MQDLSIGQPVLVSAVADTNYNGANKILYREPYHPFQAVVTGIKVKHLGKAVKSYYDHPCYLAVSKQVRLWEVRTGMENKPLLVHDEDLIKCRVFEIPRIAPKPKLNWKAKYGTNF